MTDLIGMGPSSLTRELAMRVPAVARARHLTCGTIAALPLRSLKAGDVLPVQPYWMYGTDGQHGDLSASDFTKYGLAPQSPYSRMLGTVDDLLFYGESLWIATLLEEIADGRRRPLRMLRIPFDHWSYDGTNFLDMDNEPLPPSRVVYIPGAHEGILEFGRVTIEQAATLEKTAADVAAHPLRLELHQTTDANLNATERAELVAEARRAMAANDGILFTNSALETKDHQLDTNNDLVISGRNAAAVDIARHVSMPAAMIDATSEGASLEYQTTETRNQQWIDYGLALYMDPVEARLSMDDILPAGTRAAFDTADLTALSAAPTGAPTED